MWRSLLVGQLVLVLFSLLLGCGSAPATVAGQTLDAWTVSTSPGDEGRSVLLPSHLRSEVGTSPAYCLRSRVDLEPALRHGPVALTIAWLPARLSLRVDGVPVTELDHPLTDRFRSEGPHRWRLPDGSLGKGRVDLELCVENTWTQASWLDTPPRLTPTEAGNARFLVVQAFDEASAIAGVATIGMVTILYFALYLRDRRRAQYGFFALEGLGAVFYPALMAGLTQPLLGRTEIAIAAVAFSTSAVATVHFSHAYFRLPRPSRLWWMALGLVVLAALVRGGPFDATSCVVPPTAALLVANAAHQIVLFTKLARRATRPTNLAIVTLSWPIAVAVGSTDFAAWLGLGDPFGGVRAGSAAIVAVACFQSVALAREHIQSLMLAESLNEELRRQVAARSRALADALARLGAAQPRSPELSPGDRVERRYRVIRLLGQGASGRVYEVERESDSQRLAMKVMTAGAEPLALARAAREAQLASRVRHPNVVGIVDVDVSSDGYFFLVMELVAGRSLREERGRYGQTEWASSVLRQIAEGLAAIHACGIVHRDLKPANVLLDETSGVAKIADFGISGRAPRATPAGSFGPEPSPTLPQKRRRDSSRPTPVDPAPLPGHGATLTATGDLLGTPHYMAPETVPHGAKAARPPADVFAFGVIAFELLVGRRPYGDMPTFVGLSMGDPLPSLRDVRPNVPRNVAAVLDSCLRLDPHRRPTAAELVAALSSGPDVFMHR